MRSLDTPEAVPLESVRQSLEGADAGAGDVCGIVLAGTYRWGDGAFERLLRGPLLAIAQSPIIGFPLGWLRANGVREVVICAATSTDDVRSTFADGQASGLDLRYVEDDSPRGPAGCARDAARLSSAKTFVVCEGALVPMLDLSAILEAHRVSGALATIIVEADRRAKRLAGLGQHLPGGIYVFDRAVFDFVGATGYQDIKEGLLEKLHAAGELVRTHDSLGVTPRVMDYATFTLVNRWLVTRAKDDADLAAAGFVPTGESMIHNSADIAPSAQIIGPVLIGPGTRIEAGATIVGPTTLGANIAVGTGAVISRSIVWDEGSIGRDSLVDASFLSTGHVIPAHGRALHVARVVTAGSPKRAPQTPRFGVAPVVRTVLPGARGPRTEHGHARRATDHEPIAVPQGAL
jgi:NDP-sugar pyrophosphorylase family protein